MLYTLEYLENGFPSITICEDGNTKDSVYLNLINCTNGKKRFNLFIRRDYTDGRSMARWNASETNLFGCSEDNVSDALGMLLARMYPTALNAFIEEYDYDGADTEDPEPESEFSEFCEAVYNCIRSES